MNRKFSLSVMIGLSVLWFALAGCSTSVTDVPTATPIPPTNTPIPPTETPVPPTPVPVPTAPPIPPTPTKVPQFSELVDVGGHKLFIRCVGEGSPTVVLEPGHRMDMNAWSFVLQEKPTNMGIRLCNYDRSGFGQKSEVAPNKPRTNLDMAEDLYNLLTNANINGPYIMVGHSMGGWIVRLFADQHPEDVVGMVLVDGGHPDTMHRIVDLIPPESEGEDKILTAFRDFHVGLLENPLKVKEYWDIRTSSEQLHAVGPLDDLPLVVLSRDVNIRDAQYVLMQLNYQRYGGDFPVDLFNQIEDDWFLQVEELSELSTNSTLIIVEGSSHLLLMRQPEAVVDAIRIVLEKFQD